MTAPVDQAALSQTQTPPPGVEDPQEVERRYLARVQEECRYLDSEGVDRRRAKLTDVFVMLQAVESPRRETVADIAPLPERAEEIGLGKRIAAVLFGRDKSQKPGEPPPKPPPPPVPLSQALKANNHLVILGEPGAGKTSVLQYVALCFASQGWARERLDLADDRIPVRVELRAYDGSVRLDDFLVSQLYRAYVPEQEARDWLTTGRLAILMDGLDEVPEARRREVVAGIAGFATQPGYRGCRIVVTSRIAGYQEVGIGEPALGRFTICPFKGPEDALPYVAGWLAALNGATVDAALDQAEVLLDQMQGQQGLRRVMSNPLLLRLAVAVYVETGEPPTNRVALYQRYVRNVAWERAREREGPRWSQEQIEAALEAIAWILQTQGEKTRAELVEPVETFMARVGQCSEPLTYLQQDLGLLASYGERNNQPLIAFRHLTFQEYFVARRLKRAWELNRKNAWRFIRPRLHHPAWREPITLLVGLMGEETPELIRIISKHAHSPFERALHRDLLLAVSIWRDHAAMPIVARSDFTSSLVDLCLDPVVTVRELIVVGVALVILAVILALASALFMPPEYAGGCLGPWMLLLGMILLMLWTYSQDDDIDGTFETSIKALLGRYTGKGNSPVRRLAAQSLSEIGNPATEPLTLAINGGTWRRHLDALLGRYTGEGSSPVRRLAARALSEMGNPVIEPLTQAIFGPNAVRRLHAVEALGTMGAPHVSTIGPMLADQKLRVRDRAVQALGQIGTPAAISVLTQALSDANEDVRESAAAALGRIGSPSLTNLIHRLHDDQALVREKVVDLLGSIGAPAVSPLVQTLLVEDNVETKEGVMDALAKIDVAAVPSLLQILTTEDETKRQLVVHALVRIGFPAVAPLAQMLDSEDPVLRRIAVLTLTEIGVPAAGALIRALQHGEPSVRNRAWIALVEQTEPCVLKQLIPLLRDEDRLRLIYRNLDLKWCADRWLVPFEKTMASPVENDKWWSQILGRDQGDEGEHERDVLLRVGIVQAMGSVGLPALQGVAKALNDRNSKVRQAAVDALEHMGVNAIEPLSLAMLDRNGLVRERAAGALANLGSTAVGSLIDLLYYRSHGWQRLGGAFADLIGSGFWGRLFACDGSLETKVSELASRTLIKIGSPAAEPIARTVSTTKPRQRIRAIRVLGEIGSSDAASALAEAANDSHFAVRKSAVLALARLRPAVADSRHSVSAPLVSSIPVSNEQALYDRPESAELIEFCVEDLNNRRPDTMIRAAELLGTIVENLDDVRRLGHIAQSLRWRLWSSESVASAAFASLQKTVARMTELEVAALGDNPPLFAPETARKPSFVLLIVLSAIVASVSGVASNLVASYLQENYGLITDPVRFAIVAIFFALTLVAGITITLRLDRQKS